MNPIFLIAKPIRTRLICEFVNKREEILEEGRVGRLPADREEQLRELEMMLQGLADQDLPN
jgi:hypothetical protein